MSTAKFIKEFYEEHPELLLERSRDEVAEAWLVENPGEELPKSFKQQVTTIKKELLDAQEEDEPMQEEEEKEALFHKIVEEEDFEDLGNDLDRILYRVRSLEDDSLWELEEHLAKARNICIKRS